MKKKKQIKELLQRIEKQYLILQLKDCHIKRLEKEIATCKVKMDVMHNMVRTARSL